MQRRIATFLVVFVVLGLAAAPALAGTSHLGGTVTTTVPTNYSDDSSTNAQNAAGASNSNFLTVQNTSPNATGTWIVSAGLSITGFNQTTVPISFYVSSPNASNITIAISQIQFSDGTTTISSGTINQALSITANNTLTTITFNVDLTTYSNYSSIDIANLNSVIFDISITPSQGNNKQFQLDAVDFASAVPEPGTIGLFALGAAGLACAIRRRRRASKPPRQ
jgi:hypothetical protein